MAKGLFGAAQQRRSSLENDTTADDKLIDEHINNTGGKESQMFKDLFSSSNKSKGIAGISNVKIPSKGSGVIQDDDCITDDVDDLIKGGPKLLS